MPIWDDPSVEWDSLSELFGGPSSDDTEIVVAASGTVWVALPGTTRPTDPTSVPPAGWVDLGYVSEDGATLSDAKSVEDIRSWQSFYPTRKIIAEKTVAATFTLLQWNETNIILAFGGGEVSNITTGVWRFIPADPDAGTDERSIMLDWVDGSRNFRLIIPRCLVVDTVETTLQRTAAAELQLTFHTTPRDDEDPFILLTDDPAFQT